MIKTLRESKAKLSELVELANAGEDVLISVRGKVKARITRAGSTVDGEAWAKELRRIQRTYGTGQHKLSTEEIFAQDREDRF